MKILFISHEATRSGAPLALLYILEKLKQEYNIYFDVLFLSDGPIIDDFKHFCNVKLCSRKRSLLYRILSFLKIVDSSWLVCHSVSQPSQYNLIYANTVASIGAAIHLKRKYHIPIIAHIHESEYMFHCFHITPEMLGECDRIITVSRLAVKNMIDNYLYDPKRIVVQNPISLLVDKAFSGDVHITKRNKMNIDFTVGFSGNGSWVKGFDILPQLIKIIERKYPEMNCSFDIVGNIGRDSYYNFNFEAKKLGIQSRIVFEGMVSNPLDYYSNFDVFLLLSREDSFPLVAEENAVVGNPIIAFDDVTGATEWLDDSCGFIVPFMDLDAVADSIHRLYTDPQLSVKLGNAAKNKVNKLYQGNSMLSNIVEAIRAFEIYETCNSCKY